MRVLIVIGTRPEAIKMAPVVRAFEEWNACQTRVLVTGQHRELLDAPLALFGVRKDFDLAVMRPGQDLTDVTAAVLNGMRDVFTEWRPDWVLTQGDTTSTFAASLAAFYARVRVGHVEAGLRTGDLDAPWPEELNRRLTAVAASLHFAPTPRAREALLREGVNPGAVHVTGNTVIDALRSVVERLKSDEALRAQAEAALPPLNPARRLILVTGHRRESFGPGLEALCRALRRLAARGDVEIVYPVHPNPNVREPVERALGSCEGVHLLPPLDYLPFVFLMNRAHLIVTDSGGVQEEAPALGKPVLVTRDTTERPEGIEAGTAELVGTDEVRIVERAERLLDDPAAWNAMARAHNPYGDGAAARRIRDILRQTAEKETES